MSNIHGYAVGSAGPEVNIRMKVDIYTEGPNEGITFNQTVNTGGPYLDGFDPSAWANGVPMIQSAPSSTNHLPVDSSRMIEYTPNDANNNNHGTNEFNGRVNSQEDVNLLGGGGLSSKKPRSSRSHGKKLKKNSENGGSRSTLASSIVQSTARSEDTEGEDQQIPYGGGQPTINHYIPQQQQRKPVRLRKKQPNNSSQIEETGSQPQTSSDDYGNIGGLADDHGGGHNSSKDDSLLAEHSLPKPRTPLPGAVPVLPPLSMDDSVSFYNNNNNDSQSTAFRSQLVEDNRPPEPAPRQQQQKNVGGQQQRTIDESYVDELDPSQVHINTFDEDQTSGAGRGFPSFTSQDLSNMLGNPTQSQDRQKIARRVVDEKITTTIMRYQHVHASASGIALVERSSQPPSHPPPTTNSSPENQGTPAPPPLSPALSQRSSIKQSHHQTPSASHPMSFHHQQHRQVSFHKTAVDKPKRPTPNPNSVETLIDDPMTIPVETREPAGLDPVAQVLEVIEPAAASSFSEINNDDCRQQQQQQQQQLSYGPTDSISIVAPPPTNDSLIDEGLQPIIPSPYTPTPNFDYYQSHQAGTNPDNNGDHSTSSFDYRNPNDGNKTDDNEHGNELSNNSSFDNSSMASNNNNNANANSSSNHQPTPSWRRSQEQAFPTRTTVKDDRDRDSQQDRDSKLSRLSATNPDVMEISKPLSQTDTETLSIVPVLVTPTPPNPPKRTLPMTSQKPPNNEQRPRVNPNSYETLIDDVMINDEPLSSSTRVHQIERSGTIVAGDGGPDNNNPANQQAQPLTPEHSQHQQGTDFNLTVSEQQREHHRVIYNDHFEEETDECEMVEFSNGTSNRFQASEPQPAMIDIIERSRSDTGSTIQGGDDDDSENREEKNTTPVQHDPPSVKLAMGSLRSDLVSGGEHYQIPSPLNQTLEDSRESNESGKYRGASSSAIFEMYQTKRSNNGSSNRSQSSSNNNINTSADLSNNSSASPLPPPPPSAITSANDNGRVIASTNDLINHMMRPSIAPPPPPSAVRAGPTTTAPMAHLDDSIDDNLNEDEQLAHHHHRTIYTISEAGTTTEEEADRFSEHSSRAFGSSMDSRGGDHQSVSMKQVISGGYGILPGGPSSNLYQTPPGPGGVPRSRSSIDSERSSLSGVMRSGGSYREGTLGDDNLSDYLQGRLTPLGGRDWAAGRGEDEDESNERDSVISETSLKADASKGIYEAATGTSLPQNLLLPGEEIGISMAGKERSFAEIMNISNLVPQPYHAPRANNHDLSSKSGGTVQHQESSDSLKYRKVRHNANIIEQDQARRDFFGTAGSNTSLSSYGSVMQDSVKHAPVLTRPPMESGGMYGQAKIGMAQLESNSIELYHQSTSQDAANQEDHREKDPRDASFSVPALDRPGRVGSANQTNPNPSKTRVEVGGFYSSQNSSVSLSSSSSTTYNNNYSSMEPAASSIINRATNPSSKPSFSSSSSSSSKSFRKASGQSSKDTTHYSLTPFSSSATSTSSGPSSKNPHKFSSMSPSPPTTTTIVNQQQSRPSSKTSSTSISSTTTTNTSGYINMEHDKKPVKPTAL